MGHFVVQKNGKRLEYAKPAKRNPNTEKGQFELIKDLTSEQFTSDDPYEKYMYKTARLSAPHDAEAL